MKSYTDIKQSKKLAEILPLKSADMFYVYDRHLDKLYGDTPYVIGYKVLNEDVDIPCWSLSALLDVLPSSTLDSSNDHYYRLRCMERFTEWHDNQIDACYEMVLKLKENSLI